MKSVGVRNKCQAHFNVYRLWQSKSITFDAAPESELLVLRDRIALGDYRNDIHQSGEVVQQEGLIQFISYLSITCCRNCSSSENLTLIILSLTV